MTTLHQALPLNVTLPGPGPTVGQMPRMSIPEVGLLLAIVVAEWMVVHWWTHNAKPAAPRPSPAMRPLRGSADSMVNIAYRSTRRHRRTRTRRVHSNSHSRRLPTIAERSEPANVSDDAYYFSAEASSMSSESSVGAEVHGFARHSKGELDGGQLDEAIQITLGDRLPFQSTDEDSEGQREDQRDQRDQRDRDNRDNIEEHEMPMASRSASRSVVSVSTGVPVDAPEPRASSRQRRYHLAQSRFAETISAEQSRTPSPLPWPSPRSSSTHLDRPRRHLNVSPYEVSAKRREMRAGDFAMRQYRVDAPSTRVGSELCYGSRSAKSLHPRLNCSSDSLIGPVLPIRNGRYPGPSRGPSRNRSVPPYQPAAAERAKLEAYVGAAKRRISTKSRPRWYTRLGLRIRARVRSMGRHRTRSNAGTPLSGTELSSSRALDAAV